MRPPIHHRRIASDTVGPITDTATRVTAQIELKKDWRLLLAVAVISLGPPLLTWLIPALGGFAGVLVGWATAGLGFYVGYKALAKETTIDRA
jgi:hypothetical protein